MEAPPRLSLVLPLYNERERLAALFERLGACADGLGQSWEIVAVDDGSDDGTDTALAELDCEGLRIVSLQDNRGKGAAVRAGVLAARGERAVVMDADLSTDLEALPRLLARLDAGADVCLGSRHAPGARLLARQPLVRESLGRGFLVLARMLFAREVQDFTCGFKGFRREAARAIFGRAVIDRWAFDVETVVIAKRLGLRIEHVDVQWSHHTASKVRLPSAVAGSLRDLGRIAWSSRTGAYSPTREPGKGAEP